MYLYIRTYVRDFGLCKIIDQTKYAFSSFLLEIKQKMSILSFNLYVFIPYYTVLNNPRIIMGFLVRRIKYFFYIGNILLYLCTYVRN